MQEQPQSHLVFSCGTSWYAVPSESASEVVTLPELTRVPGAPGHLLGVFAHRGEVIPLVDLGLLLLSRAEGARRAVLLRVQHGAVALTAHRVAGVGQVEGTPGPLSQSGVRAHLRGPARVKDDEVAVIDPEGLFAFLSEGSPT